MALEQQRCRHQDLFPYPNEEETCQLSPPPFYWLSEGNPKIQYQLIVEDESGEVIVEEKLMDTVFIPRVSFPAGTYRWNLKRGDEERGWWTFTIPDTLKENRVPTAQEILSHVPNSRPRHVLYPEDIPEIIERQTLDIDTLKRNIKIAYQDGWPRPPRFHLDETAMKTRQYFGAHREDVDRNLVAGALGYVLLGDQEAGAYAKRSLLEVCSWNPEGPCSIDSGYADEPGCSHARCLPAAYDWTYGLYDKNQHQMIQHTLATYARQIVRRFKKTDFFSKPGDSHAGRLPGYLGEIALVLHGLWDAAECEEWLTIALKVYGTFFPHYGNEDGGWAEGTFYSSSYTKWYLPFFLAVERHSGYAFWERPFYQNYPHYLMHFRQPGWEVHPFGDGYWCKSDDAEWPGFFAQNPYRVYANCFGPDLANSYQALLPQPEIFKLHLLDIFHRPLKKSDQFNKTHANSRAFKQTGLVSIHHDLSQPKTDTALLIRASRFGSGSHRHADQGNFSIISHGKALISPSGYFGDGYGTPHHQQWTRQSKAHNCLLINGEGQPYPSATATGEIIDLSDDGHTATTTIDITAAYGNASQVLRHFTFTRPGLIIIKDEIVTPEDSTITFCLHSLSEPICIDTKINIKREPAKLSLTHYENKVALTPIRVTDQFDTDVNEGIAETLHVHPPKQYHMQWQSSNRKQHALTTVICLNDVECAFESLID